MAEKEAKKKTKRPTAEKRLIQNKKQQAVNRSFKSQVKTALRQFEETKQPEALNRVFSLMDKGVKRGIFKLNKSSRTKSRLSAKLSAA
ncbi:MAG: 30S ribosomal protein S20 [Chlamydiia bacterium]|nr:30S ribosomal protein S20 [Chlamydiia bacterium]